MVSFERILFPIDFSPQSRAAAPFVKALATRFRSEVSLLHVVEVPPAWYGSPEAGGFDALIDLSNMLDDRRQQMEKFLVEGLSGLAVQKCVQSGDPALQIRDYARQKRVDLIMMPTHGYGPFRGLLLGSVTAKVLHDVECPVWTTAHTTEIATNVNKPWRLMICAVDDDNRDLALIRWAAELASEQDTELVLIHAVGGFEAEPEGVADPLREFLFGVARERIERMQSEAGTRLELSLVTGNPAKVVRQAALQRGADLVLVGRGAIQKHFGRLRSNAYAIIRDAPCPVISF
jgi:nucleotide-binding universal stress UspA family protein